MWHFKRNPQDRSQQPIKWYIENVKSKISASVIEPFKQPVCFMCMEKDIDNCHRKVILITLRQQGLNGKDLFYPISTKGKKA
jgi:uncharacterized protein (DUF488 family)